MFCNHHERCQVDLNKRKKKQQIDRDEFLLNMPLKLVQDDIMRET